MTYDDTFESAMRDKGYDVRCQWQMKGPKHTMITGMECLFVRGGGKFQVYIVQTFKGGGWEVFAPVADTVSISGTLEAAEERLTSAPIRASGAA